MQAGELPVTEQQTTPERSALEREAVRLVLVMAPSFQGGHSKTGGEVADMLGIPFPLTLPNLAKKARALGFDPDNLWPWWKKMREDRAAAEASAT